MGDRTWCTLSIEGILAKEDLDELVDAISSADPQDGPEGIRAAVLAGTPSFEFEEVNYAQLDDSLASLLEDLRLSYAWSWEAGDEYGAGVTIFDARKMEKIDLDMAGDDIAVTLRDIDREGYIDALREWDRIYRATWKFFVYASNHELIAAKDENKLPEGYFEILKDRRTEAEIKDVS